VSGGVSETVLNSLSTNVFRELRFRGAFPDGKRFLVQALGQRAATPGGTLVIDSSGSILSRFDGEFDGFNGTTITADGLYIVGSKEVNDGHQIISSQLLVADYLGSWTIPVTNVSMGMWPSASRIGNYVVFTNPENGAIHVGTLELHY